MAYYNFSVIGGVINIMNCITYFTQIHYPFIIEKYIKHLIIKYIFLVSSKTRSKLHVSHLL